MPEKSNPAAPEEPAVHDLFSRDVRPPYNWHEWLTRWNVAKTTPEVLGLLHCGFDVNMGRHYGEPEYSVEDRLAFYLRIANGWHDSELLRTPEERKSNDYGSAEARKPFARKAFDIVCQRFFKQSEKYSVNEKNWWVDWILSEKVLTALQNFFRVEKKYLHVPDSDNVVVRNLPERPFQSDFPHQEKLAVNFLLQLNEALWQWEEKDYFWLGEKYKLAQQEHDAKIRTCIDAARLWMIEVLCELEELNALRKHMLELSDAHIKKLTEIALRGKEFFEHESGLSNGMKATTLEEALYLGSPEALLLLERKAKMAVKARLKSIREAEQVKQEAEQKLKELTGK